MGAYGGRGAEKTADRPALRQVIDMPAIVGHLSQSLQRELDFTSELENIQRMRRVLEAWQAGHSLSSQTARTAGRAIGSQRVAAAANAQPPTAG